jgi:hypothetical protein
MIRLLPAVALLAVVFPASAEWTEDQRTRFIGSCIEGCQSTPDLSASGRAACPKACNCLADEGEKMMTPADFDEADKAAAEDKMTPKMEALAKHFPACARQASGR